MMKIVDVHVHVGNINEQVSPYIHGELRKIFGKRSLPFGDSEMPESRNEGLIKQLDQAGVDVACIMAGDWNRVHPIEQRPYSVTNEFVAGLVAEYPKRFVGVASPDPIKDPAGAAQELEYAVTELGFRAVKVYPTYHHFDPMDEQVFPLYKKAIELDIPVHFHMGWTPVKNAPMKYQQPYLLDEVGRKFPEMKVIVAHLAYPWVDECIALIARHENFHGEIAFWGQFQPEKILRYLLDFGAMCSFERLVYGSENPFLTTYPNIIKGINEVAERYDLPKVPEKAIEQIMGENAIRLYKLEDLFVD